MWAFILMMGLALTASAGPLAPSLSKTSPTAGETTMLSSTDGVTPVGYVEWMVLTPGNYNSTAFSSLVKDAFGGTTIPTGQYLYAYEVKSLINDGQSLTIKTDSTNKIMKTGSSNLNLDANGHDAVTFANLGAPGPEEHHVANESNLVSQEGISVDKNKVTWAFDGNLDKGQVSETLWFIGSTVPTYKPAIYSGSKTGNGDSPSGGTSGETAHMPVPGAMVLAMIGFGVIGWFKRRDL
jgi:hypothetical protein